jgi:hypothetical protein
MQLNPSEISELIRSRIQNLDAASRCARRVRRRTECTPVHSRTVRRHVGEMLEFPRKTRLALNLSATVGS